MATRKAITLVSGLFQEVNTPTDKLDFAGNTTADLTENTNLYYTDTRSRAAISVTDSGGDGSLGYNNSTGVITYTGPSSSEARAHFSVASGSGLTYNSGTGEFGTSAIPNGQLANSSLTIGSTSVSLGATQGTFAGLTSLASGTLIAGVEDAANAIEIGSGNIIFEGSTADANETILTAADATGGDKTLTLPNETGTILSTGSSIANSNLANSTITLGSDVVSLGDTVSGLSLTNIQAITRLQVGAQGGSGNIVLQAASSGGFAAGITFEGASGGADTYETVLTVADPTGDATITLPNATGTVALLNTLSIDVASGLTYNSSTGQFGTNAIPNSKLANSSITIGGTGVALGGSITTFSGLTSVTADAVVTKTGGFRVIDNTDNTKQLAFDASAISGSTTRTLAVPNKNGTIITEVVDDTSPQLGGQLDTNGNNIKLPNSNKILLGTNSSYEIFNDSTNLIIDQGTDGQVTYIRAKQNGTIQFDSSDTGNHVAAKFKFSNDSTPVSSVELYHGNSKKAETVTGGFTVTGVCTATSFTGALNSSVTATTQSASDNSTKVATTAYVDNQVTAGAVSEFADNVFRVKDNSDASKKLAFECSGISGSTTRTMTVPNTDGTISTESFATAIAVALG